MRAGNLDRRLTIERKTVTEDALGGQVETWAPVAGLVNIPCQFEQVSDAERWRAAEIQVDVSARFTIRWSPVAATITPLDRIQFEGREYGIMHKPKEVQRRRGLELTASARGE